ncbi:phospholipase A and acyltransferase 3-like [Lethenteron reissneri]|uniref:phospholipase A and acyltransferase 3-like n=1 Tax=Lethenteron reissneri TaxID=7753 RepID=UPI002AB66921|nr:phospholipase A and acyltransferase 3-like [Lethenteron reissneri]
MYDLVIEADSKEFEVLLLNRELATKSDPKPGDLIEIFRKAYQHWAIYVGDGYVVHITSDGMCSGVCLGVISCSSNAKAVVRRDKLVEVVGTDKWKVNNKLGNPLPVAEILESCRQMVNKKLSYNICKRNCEHFVTLLRFGQPHSKQADKVKTGAKIVGFLGTVFLAALAL